MVDENIPQKDKNNTSFVIKESSKPNSYEIGTQKDGRHKIYYDTAKDLDDQIKALKEKELWVV